MLPSSLIARTLDRAKNLTLIHSKSSISVRLANLKNPLGTARLSFMPLIAAVGLIATCLLTALPRTASATEVIIPLSIDDFTLTEALKHQVYDGPSGRAQIWAGSDKCQYLHAHRPRFERTNGVLVLATDADLSLGLAVAGKCLTPITWSGIVEIALQPYVAADLAIKFHVTNLNLYNSAHEKTVLLRGFDLIKGHLGPRLEDFSYDLRAPLHQLEDLIQAAATPDVAERIRTALSTMRPMSAVVPADDALKLSLELNVPDVAAASPAAGPAALTPAEITAWQAMLDGWDAFIVFAIKQLAGDVGDKQFRSQLFDLLLDSRYRLVDALAQPLMSAGPDPIRLVFLDEWSRLRSIIQSAAHRGILGSRALEFLSFVTAGDALFAADQAAPALGMRISEQDLRKLAQVMAPLYTGDPLTFSYDPDPQLQQLFGFTEPLESPGLLEVPGPDNGVVATPLTSSMPTPVPLNSPSPLPTPTPGRPSATPVAPSPTILPTALRTWFGWFAPRDADASEEPLTNQILNLGSALKLIVVEPGNADGYAQSIRRLLTLIAEREIDHQGLAAQYRQTFLVLVKSTAWQESCWRQFIRVNGRVRFLESDTADVGLMQVNKHVWRGFYSIPRLEWDIAYNVGAGTNILMRLMSGGTARATPKEGDSVAEIARSTYAAYNGGPNAYNRWRRPDESAEARDTDWSFWTKFRAVNAGQLFDILSCASQWGRTPVAADSSGAIPPAR